MAKSTTGTGNGKTASRRPPRGSKHYDGVGAINLYIACGGSCGCDPKKLAQFPGEPTSKPRPSATPPKPRSATSPRSDPPTVTGTVVGIFNRIFAPNDLPYPLPPSAPTAPKQGG